MAVAISVTPVATFDPHGEPTSVNQRWIKWVRNFETFAIASGCTEDGQKRQLFLHCAGPDVQDILETLTDTGNTFAQAKTKLDNYFKPKDNIPYNRHLFRQCGQQPDETIAQYVTRLRKLAASCNFADAKDDFIRDQVVEKCKSNVLRRKLLAEADLTLAKVLTIAQASTRHQS